MRKTAVRIVSAVSAAVMMAAACPAPVFAAEPAAAEFDSSVYCEIEGKYENSKVIINWKKIKGAECYKIYRESGNGFVLYGTTKKCSFSDKKAAKDRLYRYRVYAVCGDKRSVPSEILHVGISKKGDAVIYTFDLPVDYEGKKKININSFDIYDKTSYSRPDISNSGSHSGGSAGTVSEAPGAAAATPDSEDVYSADVFDDDSDYDYGYWDEADAADDHEEDIAEPAAPAIDDIDDEEKPQQHIYCYQGEDEITAGTLTAGRLDDNGSYNQFRKLFSSDWKEYVSERGFTLDDRYTVKVTDEKGKPVENASAELRGTGGKVLFRAKTNNKGIAYIFTGFAGNEKAESIAVPLPNGRESIFPLRSVKNDINVKYTGTVTPARQLDIMLTIDSTGSMSDEIKYLEAEFKDVVERVSKDNAAVKIRTSVNFYRDKGDEYIYRAYNFRTNTDTVTKSIGIERAYGGGDYPEAVHTALDISVNDHKWNKNSTKIMFLVLDAPPHDGEEITADFFKRVAEASAAGIRIIPVVASGGDTDTEYLMRIAAAATGGTYIFLTDDSGVGLSHEKPTAGQYEVMKLNDLMVKVIDEYLN